MSHRKAKKKYPVVQYTKESNGIALFVLQIGKEEHFSSEQTTFNTYKVFQVKALFTRGQKKCHLKEIIGIFFNKILSLRTLDLAKIEKFLFVKFSKFKRWYQLRPLPLIKKFHFFY